VPLTIAKDHNYGPGGMTVMNLLSAKIMKMSIANISSLKLKAGKGLCTVINIHIKNNRRLIFYGEYNIIMYFAGVISCHRPTHRKASRRKRASPALPPAHAHAHAHAHHTTQHQPTPQHHASRTPALPQLVSGAAHIERHAVPHPHVALAPVGRVVGRVRGGRQH